MSEIIYILTNEKMPGLVKIGMTRNESVEKRIKDLSAPSGVPIPFECHFAAEVKNAGKTERILHQLFSEHRVNQKREFFEVAPEKVVLALTLGDFTEVTPGQTEVDPEEVIAIERAKTPRSRINLTSLGIYPSAVLCFSRDESITATVIEGNKIEFEGRPFSLSPAALLVLQNMGYKSTSVSGSDYWMYEGETLGERRNRMESSQFASNDSES